MDYFIFVAMFLIFLQVTVFPIFLFVQLYHLSARIQEIDLQIKELSSKVDGLDQDIYALVKNESVNMNVTQDVLEGFFNESVGHTLTHFYTTSIWITGILTSIVHLFIVAVSVP